MKFTDCVEIVGSKPTLYEGTKQYVSTGAVEEYFINKKSIEEYTYNDRPSRADLVGKDGDILFAKMAETKKTLIINKETEKYLFSTGFFAIRPRNGVITTKCLYYLLNSKTFLSQKDKNSSGATQKAITNIGLEKINVNIPPFSKQEQISKQFDVLTNIINKSHKQLENLDLLIKSRFIEMFGDPVKNPLGWEVRKLKETSDIITGNTPSRKDKENYGTFIEWIKTDNITDKTYVTTAAEYLSEKGEMLGRTVEAGSILMACIAGSLRSIGRVALTDRKVAFNQQINAIVPKKYNSLFLYILFQNTQSYAQSTVNMALKGILSKGKLEELEYILPPIELQNNFAAFIQQIDKSKFAVQKSLEKAETLYKSLMQEYFG